MGHHSMVSFTIALALPSKYIKETLALVLAFHPLISHLESFLDLVRGFSDPGVPLICDEFNVLVPGPLLAKSPHGLGVFVHNPNICDRA